MLPFSNMVNTGWETDLWLLRFVWDTELVDLCIVGWLGGGAGAIDREGVAGWLAFSTRPGS